MRFIIQLILLSSAIFSLAQPKYDDLDIVYGPMFRSAKRAVPTDFIGFDKSGFYVTYARGKHGQGDLMLAKFDYEFKPILEEDLHIQVDGGYARSANFFLKDNRLYQIAILSSYTKKGFYLQEIDQKTFEPGPHVLLATHQSDRSALSVSSWLSFSNDSSRMALAYNIPGGRNEPQKIAVQTLDNDLAMDWKQTFQLPFEDKLIDIKSFRSAADGTVYMLTKRYFDKRRNTRGGEVNYDYLIFSLRKDGRLDTVNVSSDDKYLRDVQFGLNDNGDLITAGFYSSKNNLTAGGAFYQRYNTLTKEVEASSYREFDIDFLTANLTEKKAERVKKKLEEGKGNTELPFYYIDEFYVKNDGSIQMIGEKRLITVNTVYSPYGSVTYTSYFYDDMVVVQIDPNGQIEWAERVAKKQQTVNDGAAFSSYGALVRDKSTILLYNDNDENVNYSGIGRVKMMKKGSQNLLMMAEVSADGEVERRGLIRQGDVDVRMRPVFGLQISDNEFLMFGHKDVKSQRFILFRYK